MVRKHSYKMPLMQPVGFNQGCFFQLIEKLFWSNSDNFITEETAPHFTCKDFYKHNIMSKI
jgi:hypothetical protein